MWDYRHEDADSTVALYILPERYRRLDPELSQNRMEDSVHHGEARGADNSAYRSTPLPYNNMNDAVHRGNVACSHNPIQNNVGVAQASASSTQQNQSERRGAANLNLSLVSIPNLVRAMFNCVFPAEAERRGFDDVGLGEVNLQTLLNELHTRVCRET